MNQSRRTIIQQQIEWRRSQTLELASDGLSEREIAKRLQISQPTIHRDIAILRRQSKEQIHKYIDEQVPWEYKKTLAGLDSVIKYTSSIMADENRDAKERLQASSIKMQALNMKMEMVAGANLVEEAIDLVDKYRGSTTQKGKVVKDGTAEPT